MWSRIIESIRDIRSNLGVVGSGVDQLIARAGQRVSDVADYDALAGELVGNLSSNFLSEGLTALNLLLATITLWVTIEAEVYLNVLINHSLNKLDDLVDNIANGSNSRGFITNVGT